METKTNSFLDEMNSVYGIKKGDAAKDEWSPVLDSDSVITSFGMSDDQSMVMEMQDDDIVSKTGRPFSSEQSAKAMSQSLKRETGLSYQCVPVSDGYVLRLESGDTANRMHEESDVEGQHSLNQGVDNKPKNPTRPDKERKRQLSKAELAEKLLKLPDEYSNEKDFEYLNKHQIRLKEAYASMAGQLIMLFIGVSMWFFPGAYVWLLSAFDQKMTDDILKSLSMATFMNMFKVMGGAAILYGGFQVAKIRLTVRFSIWPDHIVSEHGLIGRKSVRVMFADVRNFDLDQKPLGRLLDYGTIQLSTAGTTGSEVVLSNVRHPVVVMKVIEQRSKRARAIGDRFALNNNEHD